MARFDYFIVFAEMRTGSNFLEANINNIDGLTCHGEAFNPHFIGYPNAEDILGVDMGARESDPQALIDAIAQAEGLGGFRFFHDHDARVLDIALADPRCAKIVLSRNPVDSFVSWKIAAKTGQWKLTNATHAKAEKVHVDPGEFTRYLDKLQDFRVFLSNVLQRTGQTAFHLAYEDLQDVEVMNGLALFLGAPGRLTGLSRNLKKQNPAPLADKVANFAEMESALAGLDRFNLSRTPDFEPRRGPLVPSYIAAARAPLLYLPLKSGPNAALRNWLAALDGVDESDLRVGFTQKTLRDWQRDTPGRRAFAVLRHPVAWAHTAFCERILATGPGSFPEIRATLRKVHNLPVPDHAAAPETDADYDMAAHRAAFLTFLGFLRQNLSAQTGTRVDPAWATQLSVLQGMAGFGLPDMILREDDLPQGLAQLAAQIDRPAPPVPPVTDPLRARLAAIYDAQVEAAARDAYLRDYLAFGFRDWSG